MAIHIIKRGTPPEELSYQLTCQRCKSILEYLVTDLQHHRNGSFLYCPVCRHGNEVK